MQFASTPGIGEGEKALRLACLLFGGELKWGTMTMVLSPFICDRCFICMYKVLAATGQYRTGIHGIGISTSM